MISIYWLRFPDPISKLILPVRKLNFNQQSLYVRYTNALPFLIISHFPFHVPFPFSQYDFCLSSSSSRFLPVWDHLLHFASSPCTHQALIHSFLSDLILHNEYLQVKLDLYFAHLSSSFTTQLSTSRQNLRLHWSLTHKQSPSAIKIFHTSNPCSVFIFPFKPSKWGLKTKKVSWKFRLQSWEK